MAQNSVCWTQGINLIGDGILYIFLNCWCHQYWYLLSHCFSIFQEKLKNAVRNLSITGLQAEIQAADLLNMNHVYLPLTHYI
jgi:hypothetical protein